MKVTDRHEEIRNEKRQHRRGGKKDIFLENYLEDFSKRCPGQRSKRLSCTQL